MHLLKFYKNEDVLWLCTTGLGFLYPPQNGASFKHNKCSFHSSIKLCVLQPVNGDTTLVVFSLSHPFRVLDYNRFSLSLVRGFEMDDTLLDDIIRKLVSAKNGRTTKQVNLTEADIRQLCTSAKEIFLSQPNLLELEAPIKICGILYFLFVIVDFSLWYDIWYWLVILIDCDFWC